MGIEFLIGGDLPVRRIGFGAMRLTDDFRRGGDARIWRAPADRDAALSVLRAAVRAGASLIDTADSYALGDNEALIASALHPYPEGLVVATKVGNTRPGPTEWVPLGRPEYLRQQVELSLRRLRMDRIDLLYLHRIDPSVPLADQIGALARLREEGKIRHIGLSEVSVPQIQQAETIAPVAAVQNEYNLAVRTHEEVVDYTAARGIAFVPYFPIAMGEHAGPGSPVAAVAREAGVTPAQVALAWLLRRADNVVPIPGTSSITHLEQNMAALRVELSDAQLARIA